jgi:lipopolysaccharide biosynthesis glycosyltransferase
VSVLNLLFTIDQGAAELFLNCARSILRSGGDRSYTAYILHSDIPSAQQKQIHAALEPRMDCRFLAVDPMLFDGFPETRRYPRQIYYRLIAPLLLPQELDRILYLDVDTVILNPITDLYETDFEGAYYVACTHTPEFLARINQARLGIKKDVPYINTGVLLLNLPLLRAHLSLEDIQSYAKEKMHTLILPDQDILAALYGDKVKLADTMRYNLSDRILHLYNALPQTEKVDIPWVRQNCSIVHYCGKNKPWKDGYIGSLGVFYRELKEAPCKADA